MSSSVTVLDSQRKNREVINTPRDAFLVFMEKLKLLPAFDSGFSGFSFARRIEIPGSVFYLWQPKFKKCLDVAQKQQVSFWMNELGVFLGGR